MQYCGKRGVRPVLPPYCVLEGVRGAVVVGKKEGNYAARRRKVKQNGDMGGVPITVCVWASGV